MNAAQSNTGKNASKASSPAITIVISVLVFIAILIGLYYLYQFLYGSTSSRDIQAPFTGTLAFETCAKAATSPNQKKTISGITDGGELTFHTWVYISDARSSSHNTIVPLFELGNRDMTKNAAASSSNTGKVILFGGLVPTTGSLVVRMGTAGNGEHLEGNHIVSLLESTTNYTNSKCDIPNIEYQRWILISTVLNSRTLDVYIDGKLARSCVYSSPYLKDSTNVNPDLVFGAGLAEAKVKGVFSSPSIANYAQSPDEIWSYYMVGPQNTGGFLGWLADYFSLDVKINYKIGDKSYTM
jgi:hypothetical protein